MNLFARFWNWIKRMFMVNHLSGFGGGGAGESLIDVINGLGLSSGLKLCLDAGDARSYTSGQKWLDLSGGGYDFLLGANSSATSTDPTFNGTAGHLSPAEHFSFDGGDYLTYDTTNETWMADFHKAGAVTVLIVAEFVDSSAQRIMSTMTSTNHGFYIYQETATDKLYFFTTTSTAGHKQVGAAAPLISYPRKMLWAFSSTIGSDNAYTMVHDGTSYSGTWGTFTPSSTNAADTMHIGSSGTGTAPVGNGTKMFAMAVWQGTALSADQLNKIYTAVRGRFDI